MASDRLKKMSIQALSALIVGGVLLFAFVLYLLVAFAVWIVTHPQWLVYAFLVLVIAQAHWLLMAWLKERFQARPRPRER